MSETKDFKFTAEDFHTVDNYPNGVSASSIAVHANAKLTPLLEENGRLRRALRNLKGKDQTMGYPTSPEWTAIIAFIDEALGESK